jgi:hypothetical protein
LLKASGAVVLASLFAGCTGGNNTSGNAVADGYHDAYIHPSMPNYFWMAAGQNFGILDNEDPPAHHLDSTSHIADQIEAAGLTWKSYQESMGEPCGLQSRGRYAAKHNPFVYFDDVNSWDGTAFHPEVRCNDHVVDYSQLDIDIANHALPNYVFITPNLDNDRHNGYFANLPFMLDFLHSRDVGSESVGTCSRALASAYCAWPGPEVPATVDHRVGHLGLSGQELSDLVAFLTILSDEEPRS